MHGGGGGGWGGDGEEEGGVKKRNKLVGWGCLGLGVKVGVIGAREREAF